METNEIEMTTLDGLGDCFTVEAEDIEISLPIEDQYGSRYTSPRDAARALGLRCSSIKAQLAGRLESVSGFRFAFGG